MDITLNKKALRRLKVECEKVKIALSQLKETLFDIDSLAEQEDFNYTISQDTFNQICKNLFEKCIQTLKVTLNNSGLTKNEIDNVVLVGDSSRIPKIQEMLIDFFGDKNKIFKTINADEAVAYGASIEAAYNNEYQRKEISLRLKYEIKDINPHSLGIANGNKMFFMIKRGDKVPCKITKRIRTSKDYQKYFKIIIYEGEDKLIQNNKELGYCLLDNLRKAKKGEVFAKISFYLDNNYCLTIVLEEENRNNIRVLEIEREKVQNNFEEGKIEVIE